MTLPNYPAGLPNISINNYSLRRDVKTVRTEMETGPARVRRRSTTALTIANVLWKFSLSEFATFENWFQQDLFDGVSWFKIPLVNGVGETVCSARFKEPYTAKSVANGRSWEVTATLEVEAMPHL